MVLLLESDQKRQGIGNCQIEFILASVNRWLRFLGARRYTTKNILYKNRPRTIPPLSQTCFYFEYNSQASTRRCLINTRVTPSTATPKARTSTMLVKID